MKKLHPILGVVLAAGMLANGCYGPCTLTRKIYHWNGQVSSDRWIVEGVFLVCAWLPVYGIATLADAVIFNSIEFWTGKNPLASLPRTGETKRIVRGDVESVIHRLSENELVIDQYKQGQLASHVRIQRDGQGMVALGDKGQVLLTTSALGNGGVMVADAKGQKVAAYSADDVKRVESTLQ